jgi:hypothetical protein
MASFPTLKTGVVAQYPCGRMAQFSTTVGRFLDGSEQRFQGYGTLLRKWAIRLELLDESELATIGSFFAAQNGRGGSFTFTDPWDGTVYANCSFDTDTLSLEFGDKLNGQTSVVVKENR